MDSRPCKIDRRLYLPDDNRLAAAATAVVVTVIAVVSVAIAAVRIWHDVCRHRTISAQSADQFSGLSFLICGDIGILRALAGLEFQRLILRLQAGNLILGQEIQNSAGGCVLAVDDVAGAGLDQVAGVASLSCHVIAHALDCVVDAAGLSGYSILNIFLPALDVAAAGGHLGCKAVDALLGLIAKLADCVVNAVETGHDRIVEGVSAVALASFQASDAVVKLVKIKCIGHVRGGSALAAAAATIAAKAKTIAAPTKQTKQKNNPNPFPSVAKTAVVIVVAAVLSQRVTG